MSKRSEYESGARQSPEEATDRHDRGEVHLLNFGGSWVARTHTGIAALAFVVALGMGWVSGNWKKLCTNAVAMWPIEWFPSVSATVGDHAASRAPFHILIALCAAPRFILLALLWLAHRPQGYADIELFVGLARTFCCGGWMYITSRDNASAHDAFMIIYLLLTLPWMILCTLSARTPSTRRYRQLALAGFVATIPPLIYQYYRHSTLRIAGAYTTYAFFEWALVVWDVAFDAAAAGDVRDLRVVVVGKDSLIPTPKPPKVEIDWTSLPSTPPTPYQTLLASISDIIFAACFWIVFTSLVFQLFYWSVWELALAGSELALLANLSPFLLNNRSFRADISSQWGMTVLRGVTVFAGMGVFAAPLPILRLVGIVAGTGAGWLAVIDPLRRARGSEEARVEGKVLAVGLLVTVLAKHLNYSVNPFWGTALSWWNVVGVLVGGLSVWEIAYRPISLFVVYPKVKDKMPDLKPNNTLCAVGLGSLVHLIHTFCTDTGTIIAWTWTGFPITGPTLHPYGALMLAIAAISTVVDIPGGALLTTTGAAGLYLFPNWTGYWSGVILVVGLLSLLPESIQTASKMPVAKTFGIAMITYCILDVVSVVTVAYAFVPLGNLVRERTDLVLGFCCLSVWFIRSTHSIPQIDAAARVRMNSKTRLIRPLAIIIALASLLSAYMHTPAPIQPYYPNHRIVSGGIWTVHFGVDLAGRDSQHRMAALLRDMQVDVVGLLESDLHRMVYGNRDLTRLAAEQLGYYVDLGPGPNQHTWGAALLSKFPILNSTHHLLPSPHGELAPAIHATLDVHGEQVDVLVSHNGQEEDPLDRELQSKRIAELINNDRPTIFLGYLVTKPHAKRPAPYKILMEDGNMQDIEIADKWRWCEYIAFRGLWRIAYARVHESDITDTELQVGKFILPDRSKGEGAVYADDKERYWHIGEDDIPERWRMPKMFRGKGVRGHRYVVWVGPVYYMPPEHSGMQKYGAIEA